MYLAIDGGGTKTEYLLLDQEFKTVGRHLGAVSTMIFWRAAGMAQSGNC